MFFLNINWFLYFFILFLKHCSALIYIFVKFNPFHHYFISIIFLFHCPCSKFPHQIKSPNFIVYATFPTHTLQVILFLII